RHLSGKTHPDLLALDSAVAETLIAYHCDVVLLAGYMKKLGPVTLTRFCGRILNTHPSLLPKHGGLNMYGQRVHAAVLQARDAVTGVTIHLVESDYDTGPIIAQREVPVAADDSVETLSARVASVETSFVVETLRRFATGELPLPWRTGSAG